MAAVESLAIEPSAFANAKHADTSAPSLLVSMWRESSSGRSPTFLIRIAALFASLCLDAGENCGLYSGFRLQAVEGKSGQERAKADPGRPNGVN